MFSRLHITLYLLVGLIFLSGCGEFQKLRKSTDWKKQYDAAFRYYEKEDYFKAAELFEIVLPIIKGSQEEEKAKFYYAMCEYNQKNYLLAAHEFKKFFDAFNRSEYAEEAFFMRAYSLYRASPPHPLDQTSTIEAIQIMQTYLNTFPNTDRKERTTELLDEMQEKLELKAFENAKLYYTLGRYKSALIAFDNFAEDYPDSDYNEELRFLKVETEYILARKSIASLQEERYRQTIEFYQDFIDRYPESRFARKAGSYYENSIEFLSSNKKQEN
ncbi:MAG: outer membrane protein assembly factor BamD [Cyclobacteriaceae bacterium]|nr:outer membrane protein assembly factor BamD [Cyclobacteriaceae bacterium]MCH8515515.1 outer membrane protein assembly factor BamD [Cyclobacteriaceae bacterium]